jgi:hypothetical protein
MFEIKKFFLWKFDKNDDSKNTLLRLHNELFLALTDKI